MYGASCFGALLIAATDVSSVHPGPCHSNIRLHENIGRLSLQPVNIIAVLRFVVWTTRGSRP